MIKLRSYVSTPKSPTRSFESLRMNARCGPVPNLAGSVFACRQFVSAASSVLSPTFDAVATINA